jgi:hypothetical protein
MPDLTALVGGVARCEGSLNSRKQARAARIAIPADAGGFIRSFLLSPR